MVELKPAALPAVVAVEDQVPEVEQAEAVVVQEFLAEVVVPADVEAALQGWEPHQENQPENLALRQRAMAQAPVPEPEQVLCS